LNIRSSVVVSQLSRALGSAGILAALLTGCADFGPMQSSGPANRTREERIAALEKSTAETEQRLRTLIEEQQRLMTELLQLSSRVAESVERTVKLLDAAEKARESGKPTDSGLGQIREGRSNGVTSRPESAAECRWLGRRTILMLLRDDLIAAEGFTRMYATLGCPLDHIGPAFTCAAPQDPLPQTPNPNLEARIDSCWQDPRLRRSSP
jgi:hypothetical protein